MRGVKSDRLVLGIMQPYFFPYLGYYDLINRTHRWIVFDVVKYAPRSWMNRNRILHPTEGWQYITVPVAKSAEGGAIKDVRALDIAGTHKRIRGQLEHYRKGRARYYSAIVELIDECFSGLEGDRLVDLNVRSMVIVCDYLGIPLDYSILSRMPLDLPEVSHPGQWALEICSAVGADAYLNPPGGRNLFVQHEWDERGIRLGFTDLVSFTYSTAPYPFIEHLSIVDVLMWNAPKTVKTYLDSRLAV